MCASPYISSETPGTSTTRTMSPYFSVKNAIAPAAIASRYFISRVAGPPLPLHLARITDLPTRLDVERILLQHDLDHVTRLPKPEHIGLGVRGIVAHPLLLGPGFDGTPVAAALHVNRDLPGVPHLAPLQRLERARALLAQLPLEPRDVHRLATLPGDQLRQVDRKAEGIVQLERLRAG